MEFIPYVPKIQKPTAATKGVLTTFRIKKNLSLFITCGEDALKCFGPIIPKKIKIEIAKTDPRKLLISKADKDGFNFSPFKSSTSHRLFVSWSGYIPVELAVFIKNNP